MVFNHPPGHLLLGFPGQYFGPSPFLCYVNDMPMSVDCIMLQYADDREIMVSDTCSGKIAELLSKIEKCKQWLIDNVSSPG